AGMPAELFGECKARIDRLLTRERALKATGDWAHCDGLDYARELLVLLDRELYPAEQLEGLLTQELIEVARAVVQQHKIALLCRSRLGIYAVEKDLEARYPKQLAVVVLDQGDGRFTLRQLDRFLTRTLDDAYSLLNIEDPAVVDEENRWGGSADIGGSPRRS